MAQAQRYKLKLSKLQFCSLVDDPAQPNAKTLLIKRNGAADDIAATARLKKVNEDLGLAFFWAFTSTNADGSDHYDLQGDQVTEFIKAAMDYMTETGGAVDVMHDGIAGEDRVVFAMPMDPEIAAAYGMVTKQTGLMVVVKPTIENLAKLKSGELNGVSIGGLGQRIPVGKRAPEKVAKAALYTDEVDGHAHKICIYDDGSLYVEYATMGGAENQHSHGIVRGDDGTLTILADSGHSHALAEGQPSLVVVEPDAIVVVAARAPGASTPSKSTRLGHVPDSGINTTEKSQMDKDKQIADLTAKNAELEKRSGALSRMSAVAFAVFKSLIGADADAFLAKTNAGQDAAAADIAKRNEEADKPVYISKSTGDVYRAKDDPRLVEMAKRLDAEADKVEKQEIRGAAVSIFEKKAPGTDETHDDIVRSIRKSGLPKERIDAMEASLKGLVATSSIGKKAPGFGGGTETEPSNPDAFAALSKGLVAFCKAQSITKNLWTDGLDAYVQTDEGKALKKAHDESLVSG